MISDAVLRAINATLSELMPRKHRFCLVVFGTSPTKWMPDISLTVDVVACGSFFEASPQEKAAVATALQELADSLAADAQASAGPE